jgi:hypothetical protein
VVTAHLITGDHAVQEIVTFRFLVVQQFLTELHLVVFMLLCEHPWDPTIRNACLVPTVKNGGCSAMVWAGISYYSVGPIITLHG